MSSTIPPPISLASTSRSSDDTKETGTSPSGPQQVPSPPPPPSSPETEKRSSQSTDSSPADRSESPGKHSKKKYSTKSCSNFKNQAKTLLKSSKRVSMTMKDFNDSLKCFANSLSTFVPLLDKNPEDCKI